MRYWFAVSEVLKCRFIMIVIKPDVWESKKSSKKKKINLRECSRDNTQNQKYISTQVVFAFYLFYDTNVQIYMILGYCSLNSLYFTVIYCWSISKIRETKPQTILHTYRKFSPETQQHIKDNLTRKESLFWFHKVHIVKNQKQM